jgi:hypothetical protein
VPEIGDKFAVRKIFFNTFQVPFSN